MSINTEIPISKVMYNNIEIQVKDAALENTLIETQQELDAKIIERDSLQQQLNTTISELENANNRIIELEAQIDNTTSSISIEPIKIGQGVMPSSSKTFIYEKRIALSDMDLITFQEKLAKISNGEDITITIGGITFGPYIAMGVYNITDTSCQFGLAEGSIDFEYIGPLSLSDGSIKYYYMITQKCDYYEIYMAQDYSYIVGQEYILLHAMAGMFSDVSFKCISNTDNQVFKFETYLNIDKNMPGYDTIKNINYCTITLTKADDTYSWGFNLSQNIN